MNKNPPLRGRRSGFGSVDRFSIPAYRNRRHLVKPLMDSIEVWMPMIGIWTKKLQHYGATESCARRMREISVSIWKYIFVEKKGVDDESLMMSGKRDVHSTSWNSIFTVGRLRTLWYYPTGVESWSSIPSRLSRTELDAITGEKLLLQWCSSNFARYWTVQLFEHCLRKK